MVAPEVVAAEMDRAEQVLQSLVGEAVDALAVKSLGADDAPLLGKIVSKLSPMIGNLLEARIIDILDEESGPGMGWIRQDPGFPDALLVDAAGHSTHAGYEVKAWYALSTELTGRFRESQNLLAAKDVRVVIVAWAMSRVVYGVPQILGVLTVPAIGLAAARDAHYHNPPDYLIVEPGDTTARTRNLRQTNVNGYKLQDMSRIAEASAFAQRHPGWARPPASPEAQKLVVDLMNRYPYRLDTNFAKVDRVNHADIEGFKSRVRGMTLAGGNTVAGWGRLLRALTETEATPSGVAAARAIQSIYDDL